jgi:pyruvate,orthophosphate dikinase
MQDIEFTVEQGALYMLQPATANAPPGARKLAVDMCNEKLISQEEAVLRLDPAQQSAPPPPSRMTPCAMSS